VNELLIPTEKVAEAALVMAGPWPATMDSVWVALGLTPFAAVTVIGKVPCVVGVPESSAVPLPPSTNVRPSRLPVSVITDVGAPVVVTAKDPTCPTVKSAVALLVITGGAGATMEMVSASVAVLPELLVAVMVTGYVAPVAAVVGPEMVAVPCRCP